MVEKLVLDRFLKIKIEHTSGSTVWNVVQFVFIACPSRGLPKYVKTKLLTTCFYLKNFFKKKQKDVWN